MPEGPEIRREADRIARALVGRVAEQVVFSQPALAPWGERLAGRRIVAVESRAKALLTRFDGAAGERLTVYTHNQLYGRWFVVPRGKVPATRRTLRFAVHTAERSALLYSASTIEVLHDDELAAHAFLRRLGPDVLDARVEPALVRQRLDDERFRGRSLGALLLDQAFVAGLGNYLRSEILFVAGVPPERRPRDLTAAQRDALADAIVTITRRAYRTGGITNDPDDVRRAKAEGAKRREYRHFVFGRDGRPCRACGVRIRREEHAGRRWYGCTGCQSA